MNRLDLRQAIIECTACPLHARSAGPVPWAGPTPATVAVLGEAPDPDEAAGRLLRRLLETARFDTTQLAFIDSVCCVPLDELDGKRRAPIRDELEACVSNRDAQLALAAPSWIILAGGTALKGYQPDLKISIVHGQPILAVADQLDGPVLFPIYHPAAVLRHRSWESDVLGDLHRLRGLIEDGVRSIWAGDVTCYGCGIGEDAMESMHTDAYGVTRCHNCKGAR